MHSIFFKISFNGSTSLYRLSFVRTQCTSHRSLHREFQSYYPSDSLLLSVKALAFSSFEKKCKELQKYISIEQRYVQVSDDEIGIILKYSYEEALVDLRRSTKCTLHDE